MVAVHKSSSRMEHPPSEIRGWKPRVLCLHGFRNNGKFLEDNIRSRWPENVVHEFDMVFPDAPFAAAKPVPGVDGAAYEWFQTDLPNFQIFYNFEECLKFLELYMLRHGPFDGILGFSQGALLAAAMPEMQKNGVAFTKVPSIKFVIIISGGKFGHKLFGAPIPTINAYATPIDHPSLHIIGERKLKYENEALLEHFVNPIVTYHSKGHTIPSLEGENYEKMMKFIRTIKKLPLFDSKY